MLHLLLSACGIAIIAAFAGAERRAGCVSRLFRSRSRSLPQSSTICSRMPDKIASFRLARVAQRATFFDAWRFQP